MRTVGLTATGFARFGIVCFLAVIVGACAGNPPPGADRADAQPAEPLQVWLASSPDLLNGSSVVFHVNRPAYVAIFDIQGSHVSAVYPWNPSTDQWLFDSGLNGFFRRHATFTRSCAAGAASPVVYRLIVASKRPLNVDALEAVSFLFQPTIWQVRYSAMSPFGVMDEVVRDLVGAESPDAAGALGGLGVDVAVDYAPFWAAVDCGVPLRLASLSEWARTAAWSQSGDDGAPSIKSPALRDVPALAPPIRSGASVAVARAGDPAARGGGHVTPTLWSTPYPISVALKRTSATDDRPLRAGDRSYGTASSESRDFRITWGRAADRVGVRIPAHPVRVDAGDLGASGADEATTDASPRVRRPRPTVHHSESAVHRSPTVRHVAPTVRARSPVVRHTRGTSPGVRPVSNADDEKDR